MLTRSYCVYQGQKNNQEESFVSSVWKTLQEGEIFGLLKGKKLPHVENELERETNLDFSGTKAASNDKAERMLSGWNFCLSEVFFFFFFL